MALLVEQATLELRSTSALDGAASVAVVLLVEQATLELRSTDRLFPNMGECREVLGGGPAPPSKL